MSGGRALGEGAALIAVCAALAFGTNAVRREPVPLRADPRLIALDVDLPILSAPEAAKAFDAGGHVFLDARDADAFRGGHVGGAFRVTAEDFLDRYGTLGPILAGDTRAVIYGAAADPGPVERLAKALLAAGLSRVSLLLDGYEGWAGTGAPTETGDDPTIEPQEGSS